MSRSYRSRSFCPSGNSNVTKSPADSRPPIAADVRRRPRCSLNRRWYQDPRTQWALIINLFLIFEFLLVLGAAEFWMMPASWVWIGLFLTLAFAAMEFWLAGTIAGTTGPG